MATRNECSKINKLGAFINMKYKNIVKNIFLL